MADNLTPQQRLAVVNRGGRLLVSAAAGSGKTKVLVDRLIGYITDPVNPSNLDDFLIITYTKAAAAELRGKIGAKITERLSEEPWNRHLQKQMQRLYLTKISTVHSFCADILREYAHSLDIPPDFRVADENECTELQLQVLEQLLEKKYNEADEDLGFRMFIDTQGFGRNDAFIPEIILKVYNSSRCHLNPDAWLSWCVSELNTADVSDMSETMWGEYLIHDLHEYLDYQIEAFEKCIGRAVSVEYMEKPVQLFQQTLAQLRTLRGNTSWDLVATFDKLDYGRLVFSKKCPDLELAEQMKAVRNACKKGLDKKLSVFSETSETILPDIIQTSVAAQGLVDLVAEFSELYSARKRMRRVLDFSDLEQKMLDLVLGKQRTAPTIIAHEIGQRFREVMVDEYQDTNEVQDCIFTALTAKRNNCFMVGDVKQSIYQFRLADPDIFIEKYNAYQFAEDAMPNNGRKVLLSSNFRSSAGVISAVNDVFTGCMSAKVGGIDYGTAEMLNEGIPHVSINEPEVELYGISVTEDTYGEEATFVANRIQELLDGSHMVRQGNELRPITPDDIVILLRSPGSVGVEFKLALDRVGIPCTTGSGTDLLQTEEVSFLRSLLQVISNPVQDIPLVAVMTNRVFGFSANELADIRGKNKHISFYESVKLHDSRKCAVFLKQLEALRKEARFCKVPQLIQRIFATTRMDSIYAAMPNGVERRENVQAFYQLAVEFSAVQGRDIDHFLEHLDAIQTKGLTKVDDQANSGSVRIMSIHKSKGLEFPVVLLCGLSRSFNQESLRAPVICDKTLGLGLSCIDRKNRVRYPSVAKRAIATKMVSDSISEEMRVLYVAMTRPRDRLIMTYAVKNLADDLRDIALRSELTNRNLFTKDVDCLGAWVLQAAMKRIEAGAFFALGGNTGTAQCYDHPWKICVIENPESSCAISAELPQITNLSQDQIEDLRTSLNFRYAYENATAIPSKMTVTQLKGRFKDLEISEDAQEMQPSQGNDRHYRLNKDQKGGKHLGNAIHAVMQYIDYSACDSTESVCKEIDRLASRRLISADQAAMVDVQKIVDFFATPIGRKIRLSQDVLREFKFSLLVDSCDYYDDASNTDKILLQGVVDCAIIEDDGITVIDFKTDYVTENTLDVLQSRYSQQIRTYGEALSRIYSKKIKERLIYSFHLGKFLNVQG